jgi:hypothetical protein
MSAIEVLLAIAGFGVTTLVVAGMILLTPRGQVPVHTDGDDPQGSQLSAAAAPRSVRAPSEAVAEAL